MAAETTTSAATIEVLVPALGESVVEATVAKWLKQEGDAVEAGEALVSLETDKVDLDVPATQRGVLREIRRAEGEDVQVGDVLAVIEARTGASSQAAEKPEEQTKTAKAADTESAEEQSTAGQQTPDVTAAQESTPDDEASDEDTPDQDDRGERATPVAKRMAAEKGIDLGEVAGAGPGGRVTRRDVEQFAASRREKPPDAEPPASSLPTSAAASTAPDGDAARAISAPTERLAGDRPEERIRMSRRRRTIADRLIQAQQTAAILTTFNDVDMSAVMELRKRRRDDFRERHGVGLGFMSFFVKATIGALKAFPMLNAAIEDNEIILKRYYDIGIAVSAEEGLVVPVLRNADRLSFAQIERAIGDFAVKAREGTLALDDLRGGTFTISNGGVFGSLLSTPILNPPQVGILGMHRIEERAVVRDGEIVIRPMMYLALSYDHRLIDGQEAVRFLVKLRELIEDPEALLLEG